jgi:methionine salvage enolase-phosphatase E1
MVGKVLIKSFRIPEEMEAIVSLIGALQNKSFTDVVTEALQDYIRNHLEEVKPKLNTLKSILQKFEKAEDPELTAKAESLKRLYPLPNADSKIYLQFARAEKALKEAEKIGFRKSLIEEWIDGYFDLRAGRKRVKETINLLSLEKSSQDLTEYYRLVRKYVLGLGGENERANR